MKSSMAALRMAVLASGLFVAKAASPISKALQLISDLQAKIVADGKEAHHTFVKFADWCEDRSKDLHFDIKTGKSQAADLQAVIEKETALAEKLNTKIEDLAASITSDEKDLKAAAKIRTKEAADFRAEDKELVEVISSLRRAIDILQREMQKGGASMLQVKGAGDVVQALSVMVQASAISASDGSKLTALVQSTQRAKEQAEDSDGDDSAGAPAAAAYEGHSSDIIETLERLLEKAESQQTAAREKETSAAFNFDMLKQSLTDSVKLSKKDMDAAKTGLAGSGEKKASAEGDLAVTTKDLEADTSSLSELHQECMDKSQDYEASTKSRGEELKALAEAKKVIAEETGGADEAAYGLSQTSLIQLARSRSGSESSGYKAVRMVRALARKQHSAALTQLASHMTVAVHLGGSEDPFVKVRALITDMVATLEAESRREADQKSFCDKELSETKAKHEDRSDEIEKLTTKIDQMVSRSTTLKEEVAGLQKELSQLASSQAEMDKLRKQENTDYVKTKKDVDQGLAGIKVALKVLRDYYAQSGSANGAATGAGASIIGLLEVVESDLSKQQAELVAAEESAQTAYKEETNSNQIERTAKEQDVKYKTKEATQLEEEVSAATSDRSSVQADLNAVKEYLKSLNAQCIAKPQSYATRKARREAEIAGLKEALAVLEGETAFVQLRSRRVLRTRARHLTLG